MARCAPDRWGQTVQPRAPPERTQDAAGLCLRRPRILLASAAPSTVRDRAGSQPAGASPAASITCCSQMLLARAEADDSPPAESLGKLAAQLAVALGGPALRTPAAARIEHEKFAQPVSLQFARDRLLVFRTNCERKAGLRLLRADMLDKREVVVHFVRPARDSGGRCRKARQDPRARSCSEIRRGVGAPDA